MFDMHERIAAENGAGGIAGGEVGPARCLEVEFPLPPAERHPAACGFGIGDVSGRDEAVKIESGGGGGKDQVDMHAVVAHEDQDALRGLFPARIARHERAGHGGG